MSRAGTELLVSRPSLTEASSKPNHDGQHETRDTNTLKGEFYCALSEVVGHG
jgi:hypothetical protein